MSPHKKVIKLAIGLLIAGFFAYLSFKNISWAELSALLRGANPIWILGGLICFICGHLIRVYRWSRMFVLGCHDVSVRQVFGPYVSCFALNNVLPFRVGDVVRLFAFKQKLGVSSGVVAATLLIERLLDLMMVLTFLILGLELTGLEIGALFSVGMYGVALLIAVIFFLALFPANVIKVLNVVFSWLPSIQHNAFLLIKREIGHLGATLSVFGGFKSVELILLSFVAWVFELGMFVSAAMALPEVSNHMASVLAMAAGTLSTAIPGAPGYVGTFHYFVKQSMILCGTDEGVAFAYAVLVHALLWLPLTVVGGFYLSIKKGK